MAWDRAFDRCRERVLEALIERVAEGVFDGYSFQSYISPIPDFAASLFADSKEKIWVVEFNGKEEVFVAECLSAHSKFYHTLACTNILSKCGALTWSLVDAYHCGLLGAKALLSSFGISFFTVHGQTCLVDLWPEEGRREEVKKFRTAHGKGENLIRIERTGGTMGQRDIWGGLERLSRIGRAQDSNVEAGLDKIREMISQKPWESRHATMYSSDQWHWRDDIALESFDEEEVHSRYQSEGDVSVLVSTVDSILELSRLVKSKFDVIGGDAYLQRPKWVDVVSSPISIHKPGAVPIAVS